jgi:hypothetical protein
MLRVHEELTALQGQSDPLEIVADDSKPKRTCSVSMSFSFPTSPMPCCWAA